MSVSLKRYELFGWDYPHTSPLGEGETTWYLRFARRTGGPVLDVPCGTGRLLCRVAEAGFDVTGIDLCEEMLEVARRYVFELTPDARQRVQLVRADMSDFRLDERFGLIYIADNSLRELTTHDALLSCLRCIRRHLRDDGVLLITERRFDPSLYPNDHREFGYGEPVVNPLTGDSVRRRLEIDLSDDGRSVKGAFFYEVTRPDGTISVERCRIDAPVLTMDDYLALFDEAGFSAEVFADYTDRPADGTQKLTCFVCEPTG